MWYIWLILSGIALIIEIFTTGFLVFWFSIGALISMISSFFTDNIYIQSTIFLITSTLLIFATKPFVKKFDIPNPLKTNVYSMSGKVGIVTQEINSLEATGQIKVNGELLSAISNDNSSIIPKNTKVEIIKIKGVKAIVTPVK